MSNGISKTKLKLMLLVLFLIFATDAALVSTNNIRIWARFSWIIIGLFVCFQIFSVRFLNYEVFYLGLYTASIMLTMIFANKSIHINYLQRVMLLWFSAIIVKKIMYNDFMSLLIELMRFIAIISLIGFIFSEQIINNKNIFDLYTGDLQFKSLIFTNVPCFGLARNYGPFWEPGAYQLYLNWIILYEIRNPDSFNSKDIFLFGITIITTKSTSGVVIFGLIVLYYILFVSNQKAGKTPHLIYKLVILFCSVILVLLIFNMDGFRDVLFSKVIAFITNPDTLNSANISAFTRFHSITANIASFLKNPIFGKGIHGLAQSFMDDYGLTSNTNSILAMGATFGTIPFLLYLILFLRSSKNSENIIAQLMFLLILFIMYSVENLMVSVIFFIILFYESSLFIDHRVVDSIDNY